MATWDTADLVDRFKRDGAIPATTEFPATPDIYAWLTEAQHEVARQIANHTPGILGWSSATLTSADSGATYTFPSSITPLAVELYESSTGRLLVPAWYPDSAGDYVWEGDRIRIPVGGTRTWSGGGPFARYVTPPTVIDGSTAPTLKPDFARVLIVFQGLVYFANRGGMRDPRPYQAMYDRAWYGDPARGDGGLLLWLKQQNAFYGAAAFPSSRTIQGLDYIHQVSYGTG